MTTRRGTSTYDSKPLVDCSPSTRPLVEKPLGFFSHGGTEQKPCCRWWCLGISGQVRSTQLSKSGECRVLVVSFPIEMAISGRPHITPQRWVRQKRWYPWITSSTWWSITQELAAMLCWAAARASACFKLPCCFRSHPSHPSWGVWFPSASQGRERSGVKRWVVWIALGTAQPQMWWVSTAASAPVARWDSNHLRPNKSSPFGFLGSFMDIPNLM